jgi:tetratricopeptide (TPR) repeat protein
VGLDREEDLSYLFKHVVTQEVAYESMPFALRSVLHRRLADYIVRAEPDAIDRNLDLLAHHYWRGDDPGRKVEYLTLAGAAAQASYSNTAAVQYYERLLSLLDGVERIDPTLKLAEILQLTGEVTTAEELVAGVRQLATDAGDARLGARCDLSMAESARRLGRFDDAAGRLGAARQGFESIGDEAGLAEALQVTGTVNAQRGNLSEARAAYEESLSIRERLGDTAGVAAITNNLGIVAQQEGDIDRARALGEKALALYRELGDRRRISSCEINLGWIEGNAGNSSAAIEHGEEAIRLAREVGDRLNLAIAQNNLGDALRDLGRLDDAAQAYGAAIEAYSSLGNPGPMMALFEDLAVLASLRGQHADAFRLLGAADALRESLGARRAAADEQGLADRLESSRRAIGRASADRNRLEGGGRTLPEAIDLALLCTRPTAVPAGASAAGA